jgi:hypothetical protein
MCVRVQSASQALVWLELDSMQVMVVGLASMSK